MNIFVGKDAILLESTESVALKRFRCCRDEDSIATPPPETRAIKKIGIVVARTKSKYLTRPRMGDFDRLFIMMFLFPALKCSRSSLAVAKMKPVECLSLFYDDYLHIVYAGYNVDAGPSSSI